MTGLSKKSGGRLGRWSRLKQARKEGGEAAESRLDETDAPAPDRTAKEEVRPATRRGAAPVASRAPRPYMAPLADTDAPRPEDTFDQEAEAGETRELTPEELEAIKDLPPIETLNRDSDFSRFMKDKVPDYIKRKALRRMFLSDPFYNAVDGLNDYDEDFTLLAQMGAAASDWRVGRGFQTDKDLGLEPEEDAENPDAGETGGDSAPNAAALEAGKDGAADGEGGEKFLSAAARAEAAGQTRRPGGGDVRGPNFIARGPGAAKPSMRELRVKERDDDDNDVGDADGDYG